MGVRDSTKRPKIRRLRRKGYGKNNYFPKYLQNTKKKYPKINFFLNIFKYLGK